MLHRIHRRLREEVVFLVSLFLAVTTSFLVPPSWSAIDWHVLGCLLALMAAVLGLEHAHLFDAMATRLVGRFRTQRAVSLAMVLLTGFLATIVTNDVALISLVPLMLVVAGRAGFNALWPVVLQTLAANIGSTLTPMGNPQNLYLFSHYHLTPLQLVLAALPFVVSGLLVVAGLGFALIPATPITFSLIPATPITFSLSGSEPPTRHGHRRAVIYGSLFLSGVAGVFHWLPIWGVAGVALLTLFVLDRALLRKLDVFLLLTFVCFFVAIGNLTHMPVINTVANHMVASTRGAYLAGLLLSQGISNVPAALLLAPFTTHWRAVFLGVNIGGMGTIIASMASLISYRLYARQHNGPRYLGRFHLLNLLMLVGFGMVFLGFVG